MVPTSTDFSSKSAPLPVMRCQSAMMPPDGCWDVGPAGYDYPSMPWDAAHDIVADISVTERLGARLGGRGSPPFPCNLPPITHHPPSGVQAEALLAQRAVHHLLDLGE